MIEQLVTLQITSLNFFFFFLLFKMSQFDVEVASYLTSAVFPILLMVIGLILIVKNRESLQHRLFALMAAKLLKGYHRDMENIKDELFKELQDFKSLDWNFRNKGLIRVLEIGVGPGSNFKYYPPNCLAIAVDPNPFFNRSLQENLSHCPNIKLEKFIVGEGENLDKIEDESIDVVITTVVLCSVKDVNAVLKEVKRVLAPGGKYIFLEHCIGDKGTSYYRWQRNLEFVWPYVFDGCHITRNLVKMIEQAGFSKVTMKKFTAPLKSILKHVVGPHIMGSVQK